MVESYIACRDILDYLNTIISAATLIAAICIAIVEGARYLRAKKDSTAVKIAARIDNDIEMVAGQKRSSNYKQCFEHSDL